MKWIKCSESLPGRVDSKWKIKSNIPIRRIDNKNVVDNGYFMKYCMEWGIEDFEWLDEQEQSDLEKALTEQLKLCGDYDRYSPHLITNK